MSEAASLPEQARGLSRMSSTGIVRVLAVASGKGGVGKTSIAVNLASLFASRQQSVILMDGDLGLAKVDLQLGVKPVYDLKHVISGECTLEQVMVSAGPGLRLVPAATGVQHMAALSQQQHASLIRAFSELSEPVDMVIIDNAAGISDSVMSFSHAAQEVIVVVCDEPASVTDAYALMKVLNREYGVERFQIVTNMVRNASQGIRLYEKLAGVVDQFLNCVLGYLGHIPFDENLQLSVARQRPLVRLYPDSRASNALRQIADRIECLPVRESTGHLQLFLERMMQADSSHNGALI